MYKLFFSRTAISKMQTIIILIVIIISSIAFISYYYGSYAPTQPNPTPTPSVTPSPSSSGIPPPLPTALSLSQIFIDPLEAWSGQLINVSVIARNTGSENISYSLPVEVNSEVIQSVLVQLAIGASEKVTATITETNIGTYSVSVGGLSEDIKIVQTGKHTLHYLSNEAGISFTLDGVSHLSPYSELVDIGTHNVQTPSTINLLMPGRVLAPFDFVSWSDGSTNPNKVVDVQSEIYLVATYTHMGSCPSLYSWNGTGYGYVADVSDGSGWLGYLEYFNPDGTAVYSYNYPYDYIKMDSTQLQPVNGMYSIKIDEIANEIFYLDSAKIIAVDHPANTDVFSTTSTFLYNLTGQGTIYTVSKNPYTPISAVDGKGQNVLSQISKPDGLFTTGSTWSWNNITLDLGNLSGAKEINLVVEGKITWPTTKAGGNNFLKYASQPGVMPSPPPYMEVKAQNGSWIRVPNDRQFPLPDVTDNTFVVNLTGLFKTNDYEIRINTYQNIQFDYIGVDTTPQQNVIVQTVQPSSADLQQAFTSDSNSSGAFTKYGDVTTLLQNADDKFVIGREGDFVTLKFPADQKPVPNGWVRDYFLVANCVFKGNGLPYVPLTVNPLPFQAMTSFPYPSKESYPYDAEHQAYLRNYNTRTINIP